MNRIALLIVVVLAACSTKDRYDVTRYHKGSEPDSVLTTIIAYLYAAPVYTSMADRFRPEHRPFYSSLLPKFSIVRYVITDDGTHYFYVIRPGPKIGEFRAVGGHFRMIDPAHFLQFREEFVTPLLPKADLEGETVFLFDEMVKGDLPKYLPMRTYVQWPNEISEYDTISYEWKLKPGFK